MHIFFWFLILAVLSLAVNSILLFRMKKKTVAQKNNIRLAPVISVTAGSYLLAACLYVIVSAHGTDILERTCAASFSIDQASYETDSKNGDVTYRFSCDNGISFHFDASSLLSDPPAQTPDTVEVYICQVQTGYRWCYFDRGTQVRYAFH